MEAHSEERVSKALDMDAHFLQESLTNPSGVPVLDVTTRRLSEDLGDIGILTEVWYTGLDAPDRTDPEKTITPS